MNVVIRFFKLAFAGIYLFFCLCMPLRAELIADGLWEVQAVDRVESVLEQLFSDSPHLQAKLASIVRTLNPEAFDNNGMLIPGKTLHIPGAKLAQGRVTPAAMDSSTAIVGRVIAVLGDLHAVDMRGQSRQLDVHAQVYNGDQLKTADNSHTQIRFSDGALVALRPNTVFKVVDYRYQRGNEQESSGFFDLLRGGFRTITGLIGKQNPQSYQVKTPVATIGIRGTHYGLRLCEAGSCEDKSVKDGLYGGVVDGSISVHNNAGERIFNNDQYFYVADNNKRAQGLLVPPSLIFDGAELRQTMLQARKQLQQAAASEQLRALGRTAMRSSTQRDAVTTQLLRNNPEIEQPRFEAGEDILQLNDADSGDLNLPLLPGSPAPIGTMVSFSFIGDERSIEHGLFPGSAALRADGTQDRLILLDEIDNHMHIPVAMRLNDAEADRRFTRGTAALMDVGGDVEMQVKWGRWQGDYRILEDDVEIEHLGSMHFISAANTTSLAALAALRNAPLGRVEFDLAGHTTPTDHRDQTGQLLSAGLTVDFGLGAVTAFSVQTQHGEDLYTAQLRQPALFVDLFSTLDANRLDLAGVCTGRDACAGNGIALRGDASLVFVNNTDTPAAGALSAYALVPEVPADGPPLDIAVGSNGVLFFKR